MDNNNLESRIAKIEEWQKRKDAQQISYPLDNQSIIILNKYFLSKIASFSYLSASGLEFPNLLVKQDDKIDVIATVFPPIFNFVVNVSTNFLTVNLDLQKQNQGSFQDGDQVFVYSTDTLPSPLSSAVSYYVRDSTAGGTQFKLAATLGGVAIDITDSGQGQQLIQFFT